MKRRKKWGIWGLAAFTILSIPLVVWAKPKVVSLDDVYTIAADETYDGNVFVAANDIVIAGTVTGDVYAGTREFHLKEGAVIDGDIFVGAQDVLIEGTVTGTVFAGAEDVTVRGVVGNLRVAGSDITIEGVVERNVLGAGAVLKIREEGMVLGSVDAGFGEIQLDGKVEKDVNVGAGKIKVRGEIGRDLIARLGADDNSDIVIADEAVIAGDVEYTAESETIFDGRIGGTITFSELEKADSEWFKYFLPAVGGFFLFLAVVMFFGFIVTGLVLVWVFRKYWSPVVMEMKDNFWPSLGWGVVYFIVTPVVLIILLVTVVGAPLALLAGGAYLILLYIARVVAALAIGWWILSSGFKQKKDPSFYLAFLLGAVILTVVSLIPILGSFVKWLAVAWALGATIKFVTQSVQAGPKKKA